YNEILIDVIKSWQTPIVQLTELGYLPDNYEDTSKIKPNLDALLDRLESYKQ
ncbi:CG15909, partial [Drosophila busckii]